MALAVGEGWTLTRPREATAEGGGTRRSPAMPLRILPDLKRRGQCRILASNRHRLGSAATFDKEDR